VQSVNSTSPIESTARNSTSRHSRHSRSSYRCKAKIRRYKYFIVGLVIVFMLIYTYTWFHVLRKSAESDQALLELRKHKQAQTSISQELEKLRSERDALVQGRIPGLVPIRFDETITTDTKYLRNIIFTLVKSGNKETYEYRLVLHNDTLSVAHPKVEILLFNDIGIQIGLAHVEHINAIDGTGRVALDPGEVRSYTAKIDLVRDEVPHYFLLRVSEARNASAEKLREHLGNIIMPQ
jgi:hypothetical protein